MNLPLGAEHDPRAPYNQPDINLQWWEREFDIENEPTCDGCGADSDELHAYEIRGAQYDFYCKKCLLEMAEEDGRQDKFNEWIDNSSFKLL
jgi:hypothetical protein